MYLSGVSSRVWLFRLRDGWSQPALMCSFLLSWGPVLPGSQCPWLPLMTSVGAGGPHRRTSQEDAWCLATSDTDNRIKQDSGTRKLFYFQFYSAEVRETFHNTFVSAQSQILQDGTEYLWFSFVSLGKEDPQSVTGLEVFIVLHYFLPWAELIFLSKSTEASLVSCKDHKSSPDDENWTEMTLPTM